jgi:hypothetical protein
MIFLGYVPSILLQVRGAMRKCKHAIFLTIVS